MVFFSPKNYFFMHLLQYSFLKSNKVIFCEKNSFLTIEAPKKTQTRSIWKFSCVAINQIGDNQLDHVQVIGKWMGLLKRHFIVSLTDLVMTNSHLSLLVTQWWSSSGNFETRSCLNLHRYEAETFTDFCMFNSKDKTIWKLRDKKVTAM